MDNKLDNQEVNVAGNQIENKQPVKKGRNLGIVSLIIGIISLPLFFVYFIGPVIAVIGTILAIISIPSTSEGRKDVSWVSSIALAVNIFSVLGGLSLMIIIWYQEKSGYSEVETTAVNIFRHFYNIVRMYR